MRSSPLLPADDPTLLFTNAGMNQFKDTFLGIEKRDYVRAASSQKCAGRAANTTTSTRLERPRRTTHFSRCSAIFRLAIISGEDAIKFAWELLVMLLKLDPARLWFTVYEAMRSAA